MISSEVLIDLSYIRSGWHYVILTLASTLTLMFLLQSRNMMKNNKESVTIAPLNELKNLCLFPFFNILTMGGFTICADIIYNMGITNSVLLTMSIVGLVLGGLSGFTGALVYIKQVNIKKNAVSENEYVPILDF